MESFVFYDKIVDAKLQLNYIKVSVNFYKLEFPLWDDKISEDDYHAHTALGSGSIRKLEKGSAHYWDRIEADRIFGKSTDTKAMEFGRHFHAAILTPELFWPRVVKVKYFESYASKDAKIHLKETYESSKTNAIFIREEDHFTLSKMMQSIQRHPSISEILGQPGNCEIAGFFQDEDTGVDCKIKPDKISPSRKWIIDLKTMREVTQRSVQYTAFDSGWHIQAAHYLEGANAIDGPDSYTKFMFICVQKSPPFTVACYVCSDEMIALGKSLRKKALLNYKTSLECVTYTDENSGVFNLEKPSWLKDNMND